MLIFNATYKLLKDSVIWVGCQNNPIESLENSGGKISQQNLICRGEGDKSVHPFQRRLRLDRALPKISKRGGWIKIKLEKITHSTVYTTYLHHNCADFNFKSEKMS